MTKYEIMAIVVNTLDEKAAKAQATESIVKRVKALGGTVTFGDFWGERGFAYMIKNMKWGYYFVAQFDLAPHQLAELKRELNIDTQIVRFLITKVPKQAPAPRTYAELKKEWEAMEKERKIAEMDKPKKKAAPKKAESAKDAAKEEKATEAPAEEPKKAAPKKDVIDKKLDEILEDSSLDL